MRMHNPLIKHSLVVFRLVGWLIQSFNLQSLIQSFNPFISVNEWLIDFIIDLLRLNWWISPANPQITVIIFKNCGIKSIMLKLNENKSITEWSENWFDLISWLIPQFSLISFQLEVAGHSSCSIRSFNLQFDSIKFQFHSIFSAIAANSLIELIPHSLTQFLVDLLTSAPVQLIWIDSNFALVWFNSRLINWRKAEVISEMVKWIEFWMNNEEWNECH